MAAVVLHGMSVPNVFKHITTDGHTSCFKFLLLHNCCNAHHCTSIIIHLCISV